MSFSDAQAMILTVILTYIWSDGFQKNSLVKTKKTSLQLFTVYAVPPDGVQDIARYTIPFALGKKQSDHQSQLIKILWQTKGLEKVTSRFCKNTNSCELTWFEQVVIQNDQVCWRNALGPIPILVFVR